jgi:hypothetical protein
MIVSGAPTASPAKNVPSAVTATSKATLKNVNAPTMNNRALNNDGMCDRVEFIIFPRW